MISNFISIHILIRRFNKLIQNLIEKDYQKLTEISVTVFYVIEFKKSKQNRKISNHLY